MSEQKDFCFCTLALGYKYRFLTQQLADDLKKHAPGVSLVAGTDEPNYFAGCSNVIAFKHQKQGILHCYYDKQFVLKKALSMFDVAIHIDADTRILNDMPTQLVWNPGITGNSKSLLEHATRYAPARLEHLKKVASKLDIAIENTRFIGESIYVIARDAGKEEEFLYYWGMIARYLELRGIHHGDGNVMGLAAAKVGLTINRDGWEELRKVTKHLDASYQSNSHLFPQEKTSYFDNLKRRVDYHYRLNRARIMALKDFEFYYR